MAVNMNMRILVVDDFKTMVQLTESLLKQFGFKNIEVAADGQQALDKLRNKPFDLVLSDWNM